MTAIDLTPLQAAAQGGLSPLVGYNQWVAWKATPPSAPGGRWKKLLINPHTGEAAHSNDPATQSDYQTAFDYASLTGLGVGFVFSDTDPFFFIDVDDCYDPATGEWSPRAIELCQRLSGAFIETSVSGTGLHIIGVGQKPDGYKSKARDKTFDIYTNLRFGALTGNLAAGSAAFDHNATVQQLTAEYIPEGVTSSGDVPDEWTDTPAPEWQGIADDDELIAAACRAQSAASAFQSRARFKDLWKANKPALTDTYPHETRDDDYDASQADSALCQHLAFWTGKDCERMDRLFRQSALYRDKWERDDYRHNTILGAVAGCVRVYQRAEVPQQQREVSVAAPALVPAPEQPRYRSVTSGQGVYSDGKDTENAATFLQCWYPNGTLRFVQEQAYRFNGKVWETVSDEVLKHEVTVAMWSSCPKDASINSTYRILQKRCTAPGARIGEWPGRDTAHLIVCQNGILDVTTGELHQHSPEFFTTSILPYSYDPAATPDQWQRFLWSTFEGDTERMELLQEWMGYQLVTDYTHHKAMVLVGAPRSGKGTIGQILKSLVGETAFQGITLDGIAHDKTMESVLTKTVLFIGDAHDVSGPDRNRILDRFLSITGGDNLTVGRLYKQSWSGVLPGRLTIAANSIPTFFDDSGAFGNRLLLIPFNRSFLGQEDLTLKSRLLDELPGICNWAITGLQRLRARGRFTEPRASQLERNEMMRQQAPMTGFLEDECEFSDDYCEFGAALFSRYQLWAAQAGIRTTTQPKFTRDIKATLRSKGVTKQVIYKDGFTAQGFRGVRLKTATTVAAPGSVGS